MTSTPANLPRSTGVFVRRYMIVDSRGQTRSLTDAALRSRRVLLDIYGNNTGYLMQHYPLIVDGTVSDDFDVDAVADSLKRQALFNSYHINAEWNAAMRKRGLRA
ncbi:hypothetical protein [Acetobacter sp.]|uniref:hypothetical protein n=1 Tax=Acetobacter sp. TaxID=440 RepID=UPI0039EB1EEB